MAGRGVEKRGGDTVYLQIFLRIAYEASGL